MPASRRLKPSSEATGAATGTLVPPAAGSPGSDTVVPGPCGLTVMPGSVGLMFFAPGSAFAPPMTTVDPASRPCSDQRLEPSVVVLLPVVDLDPVCVLVPDSVVVLPPAVVLV